MSVVIPSLRAAIAVPPWVKNELWRRARAVPSLDLRFADNKSLVDAVTGQQLVTFTRASSGTFVDSAGVLQTATTDVPRFDHNPTTGESLGLLVEEARTNLLLQSEDFSTTWAATRSTVTANATTAPNGTLSADKLTEDSSTNTHPAQQSVTVTIGTAYTASVFAKAGERTFLCIFPTLFGITAGAWFNLTTGTVGTVQANATASMQTLSNGWFRCMLTWTATSTTGTINIAPASANNVVSYTGDGTSGLFLWGADLQPGSTPSSYIPTTTTAVTRSADVASITGSNVTSWLTSFGENTFYVEYAKPPNVTGTLVEGFEGNTALTGITLNTTNNNRPRVTVRHGSSRHDSGTSGLPEYLANNNKLAGGTSASGSASASNGTLNTGGSPTQSDWNASSSIGIGSRGFFGPTIFLNGTIRRICYWPQRLANSTLQNITQ